MFGKLTRERCAWHPDKLVCRRFNIADPYPELVAQMLYLIEHSNGPVYITCWLISRRYIGQLENLSCEIFCRSDIIGLRTVKRDKCSIFNFLTFSNDEPQNAEKKETQPTKG